MNSPLVQLQSASRTTPKFCSVLLIFLAHTHTLHNPVLGQTLHRDCLIAHPLVFFLPVPSSEKENFIEFSFRFFPSLDVAVYTSCAFQYPLHRVFFTVSHRSSNGRKDFSSCIEVTSPSGVPHRFLAGSDHDDRDALTHTLEGYFIDFPEPATAHRVSYGASALCWKTPKPT